MNFVPNFLTLNIKVTYKKGRLYSVTLELSVFSWVTYIGILATVIVWIIAHTFRSTYTHKLHYFPSQVQAKVSLLSCSICFSFIMNIKKPRSACNIQLSVSIATPTTLLKLKYQHRCLNSGLYFIMISCQPASQNNLSMETNMSNPAVLLYSNPVTV